MSDFLNINMHIRNAVAALERDCDLDTSEETKSIRAGEIIREAISAVLMNLPEEPSGARFDFWHHLTKQAEWSEKTFGPGARVKGVVDHIHKELKEIEAAPGDLEEWIDVAILALDGAWRSGASASEIINAMIMKQAKNEARTWPDWRTMDPNKAIEHDRSKDPA